MRCFLSSFLELVGNPRDSWVISWIWLCTANTEQPGLWTRWGARLNWRFIISCWAVVCKCSEKASTLTLPRYEGSKMSLLSTVLISGWLKKMPQTSIKVKCSYLACLQNLLLLPCRPSAKGWLTLYNVTFLCHWKSDYSSHFWSVFHMNQR